MKDAAGKKIDEMKAAGRTVNYTKDNFAAECQYIDYATLKKHVQSAAASPHRIAKWTLTLAISLVTIAANMA